MGKYIVEITVVQDIHHPVFYDPFEIRKIEDHAVRPRLPPQGDPQSVGVSVQFFTLAVVVYDIVGRVEFEFF